jgi:P pilus assembly chaperone PapD
MKYRNNGFQKVQTSWPRIISIAGILLLAEAVNLAAGVLVAPTVVFLSERSRTGRLTIQNPTNAPKEISVNFSFGLPTSDSLGNVYLTLQDTGVTDPRSALGWIKAFPRKVLLAPNGSQVIRLVANPPAALPDGEYWARIVVRSQEGELTVPNANEPEKITTKLNMVMQTAIMLKYRTGRLTSELKLEKASVRKADSNIVVTIELANYGNVSYVGVLKCRLLDTNKNEISSNQIDLAVYRSLKRRIELPFKSDKTPSKVELSISNDGRTDISPDDIVPGNKIEYAMKIE